MRLSGWVTKIIRCNPRFAANVILVSSKSINACVIFKPVGHGSGIGRGNIIVVRKYYISMKYSTLTTMYFVVSMCVFST